MRGQLYNFEKKSPCLKDGKKNIICDIDGVITQNDPPNEDLVAMMEAHPNYDARIKLNKWYEDGNIITFFTARTEDLRSITEVWLLKHGFKYDKLIMGKPRGGNYHYIDDKVIRATRFDGKFGEFSKKLCEIEVFT